LAWEQSVLFGFAFLQELKQNDRSSLIRKSKQSPAVFFFSKGPSTKAK